MDQNQQEPPQTAAPERSVCSRRPRNPRNPQTWTPREGEGGFPSEGGFGAGIVRGVIEASLAWVVILRASFVGILVCCARVGMFPVRMEKGSNYSRKSIVTYGSSFRLFPHTRSLPISTAAQARLHLVSNLSGLRPDPHWESSPEGPVGSGAAFPTPATFPTQPHPQGAQDSTANSCSLTQLSHLRIVFSSS